MPSSSRLRRACTSACSTCAARSAVNSAALELPPQAQRAFRLHKFEGLSHAETARVMGLSVKAVEKHVSAALKALTAKLAPRFPS